jgi:hypothetical protein
VKLFPKVSLSSLTLKRFTSEMDPSFVPKISAVEGGGGLVLFSGDSIDGISPGRKRIKT